MNMLITYENPTKKQLYTAVFSALSGFSITFTFLLFLTLRVSYFGDLVIDISQAMPHASQQDKASQLADATVGMTGLWWWMMVVFLGTILALKIVHVFGEKKS